MPNPKGTRTKAVRLGLGQPSVGHAPRTTGRKKLHCFRTWKHQVLGFWGVWCLGLRLRVLGIMVFRFRVNGFGVLGIMVFKFRVKGLGDYGA